MNNVHCQLDLKASSSTPLSKSVSAEVLPRGELCPEFGQV